MHLPENVTDAVAAAVEQWEDQRVIETDDLEDLLTFFVYGRNVLSQNGMRLAGFSFRHKQDQTLLSIKVRENGTPLIVFITGPTPMGCVSRFLSLADTDRLAWVRDKYP